MMKRRPPRWDRPSLPCDAGDFGRCHRLLLKFPEWRARLTEVAAAHSAWAPLVAVWDELTELFEVHEGCAAGSAERSAAWQALRDRLSSLRGAAGVKMAGAE